jgi:hypothetical protein
MPTPETPLTLAAVARPGDTIIIGFNYALADDDIEALAESFAPLRDKGIEVAFADHVQTLVIARPDDEDIDDWGGS